MAKGGQKASLPGNALHMATKGAGVLGWCYVQLSLASDWTNTGTELLDGNALIYITAFHLYTENNARSCNFIPGSASSTVAIVPIDSNCNGKISVLLLKRKKWIAVTR